MTGTSRPTLTRQCGGVFTTIPSSRNDPGFRTPRMRVFRTFVSLAFNRPTPLFNTRWSA